MTTTLAGPEPRPTRVGSKIHLLKPLRIFAEEDDFFASYEAARSRIARERAALGGEDPPYLRRVGKRLFIDLEKLYEWVDSGRAANC